MSLLERLMTKVPSYGRLPAHGDAAGKYDTSLLTKLLKNYRSHPAILKASLPSTRSLHALPQGAQESVNLA